jgi:hypothetical protein
MTLLKVKLVMNRRTHDLDYSVKNVQLTAKGDGLDVPRGEMKQKRKRMKNRMGFGCICKTGRGIVLVGCEKIK